MNRNIRRRIVAGASNLLADIMDDPLPCSARDALEWFIYRCDDATALEYRQYLQCLSAPDTTLLHSTIWSVARGIVNARKARAL